MAYEITITKLNRKESIDFAALPAASQTFVINYGLRQLLNDSFVSGETHEERVDLLDRKLSKLFEGTLHVREGGSRESDPLAREITKLATAKTSEHFKKKGVKAANIDPEQWKVVLGKFRVHPKLVELAKAIHAHAVSIEIE